VEEVYISKKEKTQNERLRQESNSNQGNVHYEEEKKRSQESTFVKRQESYGLDIAKWNHASLLLNSQTIKTKQEHNTNNSSVVVMVCNPIVEIDNNKNQHIH